MTTIEVTRENLEATITDDGIVLLDFWAPWCAPCRTFGPIFERSSEQNPQVTFGKVNTEEQQDLAAQFHITSIPTLLAFRDGILVFMQPGALPEAALDRLLQGVAALDMGEVRTNLEQEVQE